MGSYDTLYDVIVCGGGTSGVAAAISAAREGAKTLLIERVGTIGGQMSISGPPGFAYARLHNSQGQRDVGGIVQETYERLYKEGHALPHFRHPIRTKAAYTFAFVDPDWWTFLIFDMLEEEGVDLLIDTLVVGVVKEGNAVKGVVVENACGRNEIKGKVVIDCTGEGYVATQAGCEMVCVTREEVQPHTVSFTVDGVDWDVLLQYIRANPDQFSFKQFTFPGIDTTQKDVMEWYSKCHDVKELGEIMGFYKLREYAEKNGEWHGMSGAGFFITPKEGGHIQAHMQHSSHVDKVLPNNAWEISHCMVECRKQIKIAWRFFKRYIPGFKNAYITKVCTQIRLREGPRIVGDYVFTKEDIGRGARFDDTIGLSSFKAGGYHVAATTTLAITSEAQEDIVFPKDHGSYNIPYRSLVPKVVDNLLAAGKCVSTDRAAYLRYLHQTMVTGQAAGVAAAICAKKNITPRELEKDVKPLQDALEAQGAIIYEPLDEKTK